MEHKPNLGNNKQEEEPKTKLDVLKEKLKEIEKQEQELIKKIADDEKELAELKKLLGIASSPEVKEQEANLENKEGQRVLLALTEKGTFDEKSIMRYFAQIFYGQRGGNMDFKEYEIKESSQATKEYLLRLYEDLKKYVDSEQFEIFDAEKILERNKEEGRTGGNLEKMKPYNGKDYWFNKKIIENEIDKLNYARMMLSNDPSGRDNGLINGIQSKSKIKEIEYPSDEVLKNLDQVFHGDSKNYDAELKLKETEVKTEQPTTTTQSETKDKKVEIDRINKKIQDTETIHNNSVLHGGVNGFTIKESEKSYDTAVDLRSERFWEKVSIQNGKNGDKFSFKEDVPGGIKYHKGIILNDTQRGAGMGYIAYSVIVDSKTNLTDAEIYNILENNLNTAYDSLTEEGRMRKDVYLKNIEKNNLGKITTEYNAELEALGQSNPETKREKPENYEGWETRYHHDIELDGKMKIVKETPKQTSMSLYELKEKDGQMALFLIESNSITKMLGSFGDRQLEPLFNLPEGRSDSPDIKLMKTIKPAKFKKEGEFWILTEKGEVEYVK